MIDTIERFFETYAERYMASDVDAVAAMYEAPFLAVRENRPIHLIDREAVREHLAGLMDGGSSRTRTTPSERGLRRTDLASAVRPARSSPPVAGLRRDRPVLVVPGSSGIGGDWRREQGFSAIALRGLAG